MVSFQGEHYVVIGPEMMVSFFRIKKGRAKDVFKGVVIETPVMALFEVLKNIPTHFCCQGKFSDQEVYQ